MNSSASQHINSAPWIILVCLVLTTFSNLGCLPEKAEPRSPSSMDGIVVPTPTAVDFLLPPPEDQAAAAGGKPTLDDGAIKSGISGIESTQPIRNPISPASVQVDPNPSDPAAISPSLFWNHWVEFRDVPLNDANPPEFVPLDVLAPNSNYAIVLDLSPLNYAIQNTSGTAPTSVSAKSTVTTPLTTLAKSLRNQQKTFSVFLMTEKARVTVTELRTKDFNVNINNLRVFINNLPELVLDPLAALRQEDTARRWFVMGRVFFNLHTTHQTGRSTIVLSFWDESSSQVIDELIVPICVAKSTRDRESCQRDLENARNELAVQPEFADPDLFARSGQAPPDALLYLVQLRKNGPLFGVFGQRGWTLDRFKTWEVTGDSVEDLLRRLQNTQFLSSAAKLNDPTTEFADLGRGILNDLFPNSRDAPNVKDAKETFLNFVKISASTESRDRLLFVRIILADSADAIMTLPLSYLPSSPSEPYIPIGQHIVIETPLPIQSYLEAIPRRCIENWALLAPIVMENNSDVDPTDLDEATPTAKKPIAASAADAAVKIAIEEFLNEAGPRELAWLVQLYTSHSLKTNMADAIDFFRIQGEDPMSEPGTTPLNLKALAAPSIIVIMGHQHEGAIRFNASSVRHLKANMLERKLGEPSVVVLNACDTGGEAAQQFIRKLNLLGTRAAIVTHYEIDPKLAGDFVGCLSKTATQFETQTLAELYRRSIRCLAGTRSGKDGSSNPPWGSRAYAYSLIGDSGIQISRKPCDTFQ